MCTRVAVVVASNDIYKEFVTLWNCWMNKGFFYLGWELEVFSAPMSALYADFIQISISFCTCIWK
jgi:hypothetical protein